MIKTIIKNKYGVKEEYELIKCDEIGYYIDMWYLCFAGIAVDNSLTIMRTSLVKPDVMNLAQALTDITKVKVGLNYSFINDMLNDEYIRSYTDKESQNRNIHTVGNHKCTLVKNRYRLAFNIDDSCEKLAQDLSDKISKNSFMDKYFIDSYFLYESMDMMLKTNIGYIITAKLDHFSMYSFFKTFYPSLDLGEVSLMSMNICANSIYHFKDSSSRYVALDVYPNNIFMGR